MSASSFHSKKDGLAECSSTQLDLFDNSVFEHTVAARLLCIRRAPKARCMMNLRENKGLAIAATSEIAHVGNVWTVPSQSSSKRYAVDPFLNTCTCLDFQENATKCKHLHAVGFLLQRESNIVLPEPKPKPTYKQEWHEYNLAQTNEKARFLELLYELCNGIEEPIQTFGRPRLSFADMIFCSAFKIYSTISSRRFISDLREATTKGYIAKTPYFNSISNYLEMEAMTPYLKHLIVESSRPLSVIENNFAVDSSGFSTGQFTRWLHAKYGNAHYRDREGWLKCHIMCGVKTNVVTSVEVSDKHAGDSLYFKPLVEATSENFSMFQVSADKAYLSASNLRLVVDHKAMPYIPFKSNSRPDHETGDELWKRMYHFYSYNQKRFMECYHRRSNVESTFSMIKAKFGERLRSKTETSQINEILCKVLCHNVCCLIQSIYELGVEPTFWTD